MDEGQRWTPGSGPALPEPPAGAQDWSAPPSRAFLGDPRWGIRADLPATTPGRGMPAVAPAVAPVAPAPTYAAPAYAAPTYAAPTYAAPTYAAPTPVYASPAAAAPAPMAAPTSGAPAAGSPAYGAPAFGAPSFGSPAAGAPAFGGVAPSRAGFAQPTFAGAVAAPFAPVRTKNPGWVIALAVLLIGGFVCAIGAAVAIPVFLNSRTQTHTAQLRTDLMTVAAAEEAVHAQSGTYSADPGTINGQLGSAISSRVAIIWADRTGFCAQAVPAGATTPQLYFSSAAGISDQSCG